VEPPLLSGAYAAASFRRSAIHPPSPPPASRLSAETANSHWNDTPWVAKTEIQHRHRQTEREAEHGRPVAATPESVREQAGEQRAERRPDPAAPGTRRRLTRLPSLHGADDEHCQHEHEDGRDLGRQNHESEVPGADSEDGHHAKLRRPGTHRSAGRQVRKRWQRPV
jgi:hypothetical protein